MIVQFALRITAVVMLLAWLARNAPGLFWPALLFALSTVNVSWE